MNEWADGVFGSMMVYLVLQTCLVRQSSCGARVGWGEDAEVGCIGRKRDDRYARDYSRYGES